MKFAMSQIFKRSAVAGLLALLAPSIAFAQVDPGNKPAQRNNPGAPVQSVLVVNGAGSPLPTAPQGTTNVAGTVNIGNSPAVTISGAPTVTVGNTWANPVPGVDKERLARIPYSSAKGFNNCQNLPCGLYITAPPDGYRLVVQHVSAMFGLPSGSTVPPMVDLYGYNQSGLVPHSTVVAKIGPPTNLGGVFAAIDEDVLAYFDPADGPGVDSYGSPNAVITVSGYLENCSITGCPTVVH
jgi:hypothetical protein